MPRLFVAISLPQHVQAALAATFSGIPRARWSKPDQLHLTLSFIGAVDAMVAEACERELKQVHGRAFAMLVRGAGKFHRGGGGCVIWAGCDGGEELEALSEAVRKAVVSAGITRKSGKWQPHITLARVERGSGREAEEWVRQHAALALPAFRVNSFVLYESELRKGGAIHAERARFGMTGVQ